MSNENTPVNHGSNFGSQVVEVPVDPHSMDQLSDVEDLSSAAMLEHVEDAVAVEQIMDRAERGGQLIPRDRKVVEEWFGVGDVEGALPQTIAERQGVSPERIRQIGNRGVKSLRDNSAMYR